MTPGFSWYNRDHLLSRLSAEHFDLLVIGGGITGAGIALDAASRGLKVALVEKNDFAFGTSSRSTKLIHGGLRYLKQLEFGLVKEVGSERAVVHKLAPHLVIPEKMLLPLSEGKSLGYWLTSIGLMLYDRLAGVKKEDQRRMLTRPQTLRYEPLLRKEGIKGGAIYAEYRTDDARLTIELVKTAFQHGAIALNYLCVTNFIYNSGRVSGVMVRNELSQDSFVVQADVVVSAAGPWVDELRAINRSLTGKRLHLTKGVHIVVSREKLPIQQATYFNVDDGRMIFAIPRGRATYIGTTDTTYQDDKDHVTASSEDARYLVEAVNKMFPTVSLSILDIESSWAGLRPLIHEEGKSVSELSRKDEIFESPSGLLSMAGGKLTGYRKMAERVVDLVIEKYFKRHPFKKCHTHSIKLTGNAFETDKEVREYLVAVRQVLEPPGFTALTAHYLVENYGQQTEEILKYFKEHKGDEEPDLTLLRAELLFCINHEMVVSLKDFFVRRTGLVNFNIHRVQRWKERIADEIGAYLKWSDARKESELQGLAKLLEEVADF